MVLSSEVWSLAVWPNKRHAGDRLRRRLMPGVGRQNTNEVYLMRLTVETEQEEDGRWIAEVSELAGVMKYGQSRGEAIAQAEALALRQG
jgi:hypothetical protein